MNYIYHISQSRNGNYGSIEAAVVAAPDEEVARNMHPESGTPIENWSDVAFEWCGAPEYVAVQLIGIAGSEVEVGVILNSPSHIE